MASTRRYRKEQEEKHYMLAFENLIDWTNVNMKQDISSPPIITIISNEKHIINIVIDIIVKITIDIINTTIDIDINNTTIDIDIIINITIDIINTTIDIDK
jgi:hypothetical protein